LAAEAFGLTSGAQAPLQETGMIAALEALRRPKSAFGVSKDGQRNCHKGNQGKVFHCGPTKGFHPLSDNWNPD